MTKINPNDKKKVLQKLLEFRKKGLLQYGRYLESQLKYASKSDIRQHYKKYIEDQIALNNKNIKAINDKL